MALDRHYTKVNPLEIMAKNMAASFATQAVKTEIERALMINYGTPMSQDATFAANQGYKNTDASLYGLPVWDTIQLKYEPSNLDVTLSICQIEVTQSRNIVTTPVQGLDGTVKEFISNGDAQIKIRATIVGDAPDYYPSVEVIQIQEILDVKDAIDVYSTILNTYMNVSSLVVTEYSFVQPEVGMRNVQVLEMTCLSDDPSIYEIIMKS